MFGVQNGSAANESGTNVISIGSIGASDIDHNVVMTIWPNVTYI
jgi:hypothetical protein